MASSLQTAVLGMRAYQDMLEVTGNNIANADTIAFKENRVTFAEMFSRMLNRGSAAAGGIGGTNPIQIGLGVRLSSVDTNMSQGSFTTTSRDFDLALSGRGFFVVNDGVTDVYTRDGSFDVDANGYLVDPSTGYRVQRIGTVGEDSGFQAGGNNDIRIPYDALLPGQKTQTVEFAGNLSVEASDPTTSRLQASNLRYTLAGGGIADASSAFADVEQLQSFIDGDTIAITGRSRDGTAVSSTFTYGAANDGTTLQDLLDSVVSAFGGPSEVSATIEEGKLTLTEARSGYSLMDIDLSSSVASGAVPLDFDYLAVGGAGAHTTNSTVFDAQGREHSLTATFVRQDAEANVWDLVLNSVSGATDLQDRRVAGIEFSEEGTFLGVTQTDYFGNKSSDPGFSDLDVNFSLNFPSVTSLQQVRADFGRIGFHDGLTQFGNASTAGAVDQDGYGAGVLQTVSVDKTGVITGTFSNGETVDIAELSVAVFDNPQGLERNGDNYYGQSAAAGSVMYTHAADGGAGTIQQRMLEDSNVNIADQFTRLIIAQRGFQVNSRTVRVANAMLQQLATIIV